MQNGARKKTQQQHERKESRNDWGFAYANAWWLCIGIRASPIATVTAVAIVVVVVVNVHTISSLCNDKHI